MTDSEEDEKLITLTKTVIPMLFDEIQELYTQGETFDYEGAVSALRKISQIITAAIIVKEVKEGVTPLNEILNDYIEKIKFIVYSGETYGTDKAPGTNGD